MNSAIVTASAQTSAPSREVLERNVAALRVRQPDVAEIIARCELPDLVPAIGRDGAFTFLVPTSTGPKWLGGCSMPQAAAEEMFGHVDAQGGSVTLPAMLTGLEAIVLTGRLAPRFAVFIVDEPHRFKVVFSLRNFADVLSSGRMVALLSDDLPARARQFFSRNPGFALPVHVFKVPQISEGELANLARTLEDAGAAAIQTQMQFVSDCTRRMGEWTAMRVSRRPRIAIVSADGSADCAALASSLERAIESLGGMHANCLPNQPDRCHVAARIGAVAAARPEMILYVSMPGGQERSLFPVQLPVVHWLQTGVTAPHCSGGGPCDVLVTGCKTDRDRACACGWPSDRVIVAEPAADISPADIRDQPAISAESPVAVMMNVPDDRPEAAGVTLPSHLALWHALQEECVRRSERYDDADARTILAEAERASGTTLTDETLQSSFASLLRSRIAPATVARSVALALVRNGFEPQIWGCHWPKIGKKSDLRKGPIPPVAQLESEPMWLVIPWFCHAGVQLAVEALARQSIVFMRGVPQRFAEEYPGLRNLTEAIHWFLSGTQLVTAMRSLRASVEAAAEQARVIARQVRGEHTMTKRVSHLLEVVRTAQDRLRPEGAT